MFFQHNWRAKDVKYPVYEVTLLPEPVILAGLLVFEEKCRAFSFCVSNFIRVPQLIVNLILVFPHLALKMETPFVNAIPFYPLSH